MRKKEHIPWLVISVVVILLAFYFIAAPLAVTYSPITVEIVGTLIGVLLALSIAELIEIKERYQRFEQLVKGLVKEMRYILSVLDDDLFWFSIDQWKMATSSGELSILDDELLDYFTMFYSHAQAMLDMGNMLKNAVTSGNEKVVNELHEAMKPFKAKMREIGNAVLD